MEGLLLRVRELFDYHEDGFLIWRVKRKNINIGDVAGSFNKHTEYYHVKFYGKSYLVHRVIFLWHKGYLPEKIDHIDTDKTNNRIGNFREATHAQNMRNVKARKNSTSEYLGVWKKQNKHSVSWCAGLQCDLVNFYFGSFKTEVEAALAYNKGAVMHFKEFANLNIIRWPQ